MAHWAVIGAVAGLSLAVPSPAPPTSVDDPLGCSVAVHDPAGELDDDTVAQSVTRTAVALDADLHVRVERTVDSGLDARMAQLEAQCPSWTVGGERAPDLVVVMYSAVEREASVYYGAELGPTLEDRWEPAVDAMGARFRDGDFTAGILDGLTTLRQGADPASTPSDTAGDDDDDDQEGDNGSSGLPLQVWLLILGVGVLIVYNIARYLGADGSGDGDDGGDDDDGSTWSSSRRRSFSSSSRSRSSSRSSRSSSSSSGRRSGRAGGGTKKW